MDEITEHGVDCGCSEYNELSRRRFLQAAGATSVVAAASVFPEWLPKIVLAETQASQRDIMVSVFQRGGADGLTLCVPFGDANYYSSRATIQVPRPGQPNGATALDNFFGFPPGMTSLMPAYTAGNLLVMHATGQTTVTRSHFDAQRWMEVGKPNDTNYVTGWLGRHLALVPPIRSTAPLRALGLSSGLPKTLVGAPKTLPIANPGAFNIGGTTSTVAARQAVLTADYADAPQPLQAAALDAIATVALLQTVNVNGYVPVSGVTYPNTSFGRALRSVAALIKADVGIEAAQADIGGWDTHAAQGSVQGALNNLMADFSGSLAAFHADVIATGYRVTLVSISEFGRNVRENGSQGTDHGRATTMFAMGTGINGGRVLTNGWPGLAQDQLEARQDLRVTLDYRDVLGEIVSRRLANTALDQVFPGWNVTMRGVTR